MRFLNDASRLILYIFLSFPLAATLSAQSTGTILGAIRDSSGAVIPNVSVKITHIATETTRETATNSVGNYIAPALQPGVYRIEVEVAGFRKRVISSIELEVDQSARIDLTLEPGSVSETVEVTAAQPLVNTESPALGQVIDNARVLNMPLNGRQFLDLTLQIRGVVTGNGGPQTGSSTMFLRPNQNASIRSAEAARRITAS